MNDMNNMLNINQSIKYSRALGPGIRAGIWLQGCQQNCPDCINPDTHDLSARLLVQTSSLFDWTSSLEGIEGVTISGGEPLLQAQALTSYLTMVQEAGLSVILYTGYTHNDILTRGSAGQKSILPYIDILIDGSFNKELAVSFRLKGSKNQNYVFLSDRYSSVNINKYESSYLKNNSKEIFFSGNQTATIIGWNNDNIDQNLMQLLYESCLL